MDADGHGPGHPADLTGYGAPRGGGIDALTIAGYVCAVVLPPIGLVIGVVKKSRYEGGGTDHGLWIMLLSVGVVLAYVLLTAG